MFGPIFMSFDYLESVLLRGTLLRSGNVSRELRYYLFSNNLYHSTDNYSYTIKNIGDHNLALRPLNA